MDISRFAPTEKDLAAAEAAVREAQETLARLQDRATWLHATVDSLRDSGLSDEAIVAALEAQAGKPKPVVSTRKRAKETKPRVRATNDQFAARCQRVIDAMDREGKTIGQLTQELNLQKNEVFAALLRLAKENHVEKFDRGMWRLT